MADGNCKVCGGSATTNNSDHSSNTARDGAYCSSSGHYIWTCDSCGTSFHADQGYPTSYDYHCPSCNTHMVYNQNKGINF